MGPYIVGALVLLAVAGAIFSIVRKKKNGGGCSGCSSCPGGCSGCGPQDAGHKH